VLRPERFQPEPAGRKPVWDREVCWNEQLITHEAMVAARAVLPICPANGMPAWLLRLRSEWYFGRAFSAGGPQCGKHFLGYPLHGRGPVWAGDNEVESGEAEAKEIPQLADHLLG
jgi:hypothetical protein